MLENHRNHNTRISPEDAQLTNERWFAVRQAVYNAYVGVNATDPALANSPLTEDQKIMAMGALGTSSVTASMPELTPEPQDTLNLGDDSLTDTGFLAAAEADVQSDTPFMTMNPLWEDDNVAA